MILLGIFLIYWTCRKSQDPVRLLFRWLLTLGVVIFFVTVISTAAHSHEIGPTLVGLYLAGVCGLVLALTWLEPLGDWAAKRFVSLFDGATTPPGPVPVYSMARVRQKQGKYPEAIADIRRELSRFPTDFEGQFLLAEILAENLKDLEIAQGIVDQICFQPGRTAKDIAFALYAMADWHLSIGKDKEAARQCLERIGELLPNTVHSLGAAQRISHLAEPTFELEPKKYGHQGVASPRKSLCEVRALH